MAGEANGIVTCPLHKEGLRAAGIHHPGHTEILAERTRAASHAMVLYGDGVAVAHVTLHMALKDVLAHITPDAIYERIDLLDRLLPRLVARPARIGVAALNPHAGDGGLFGEYGLDNWEWITGINQMAVVYGSHFAIQKMKAQKIN